MNGERLPASYANFYIANGVVIVPTFNDRNDRVALNTLASLMPDREVVGIHAVDLVWGLGTLHCLRQQQPRAERCSRGAAVGQAIRCHGRRSVGYSMAASPPCTSPSAEAGG